MRKKMRTIGMGSPSAPEDVWQRDDACKSIDWTQPLTKWSREEMAEFLITAMRLIRKATIARDISESGIIRRSSADVIARQANCAAGGPLMTPDEFNDEIGL
jgi:hypothetical protein